MPSSLCITFGVEAPAIGPAPKERTGLPSVEIDTAGGIPLRFNNSGYAPRIDGERSRTEDLVSGIKADLRRSAGDWSLAAHGFIDGYFDALRRHLDESEAEISSASADGGRLFGPWDWIFSALRPLPNALVPLPDGEAAQVDFLFWTGREAIAIDVRDRGLLPAKAARRTTALSATAVEPIALPANRVPDWQGLLRRLSPDGDGRIWSHQLLPAGLFGCSALYSGNDGECG